METNLIQIEKGKYTALLRRVLGMRMSENGVPELQVILTTINNFADGARRAYEYGSTREEIEDNFGSIEFALEYYNLRREDLFGPDIKEQEQPKVVGKINLCKD
jgi:hypothetical protein